MNETTEYKPSKDIMPHYVSASVAELFRLAGAWIDTAAQYARNEEYWRERALKAEGKSDAEIADWGH